MTSDNYQKNLNSWLNDKAISASDKAEIQKLVDAGNTKELQDRFYRQLEFGTGGMRGVVAAGTNRMNVYVIRQATEALCRYIKLQSPGKKKLAVFYDSRVHSRLFAEEAASVIAGNGFRCLFTPVCSATPILSFVVRKTKCDAGINITASHNPPEYNGYKVFWNQGEQIVAPHDTAIVAGFNSIKDFSEVHTIPFAEGVKNGSIEMLGEDVIQAYYDEVVKVCPGEKSNNAGLKLVYTPLHGVGGQYVQALMKTRGFTDFTVVPTQAKPDGTFPTLKSPNPEDKAAFDEAKKTFSDYDLIVATDPDADRLGCVIRENGELFQPNGNQIGVLLLDYVARQQKNKLSDHYFISTVVSSPLLFRVAESFGLKTYQTYTGFKNIAEVVADRNAKGDKYLFACEESHGYQLGDFVRDKDGISAAVVFAEIMAEMKAKGQSLKGHLDSIYKKLGYQTDEQLSYTLKGIDGGDKIRQIMKSLRDASPKEINGIRVVNKTDFMKLGPDQTGEGKIYEYCRGKADMLLFELEGNARMLARPSGTEPKIKFYVNVNRPEPGSPKETLNSIKNFLDKLCGA